MSHVLALATRSQHTTLHITDAEVMRELERHEEGDARDAFATHVLRLGLLALHEASGALEVGVLRREHDPLLACHSEVANTNGQLGSELAPSASEDAKKRSLDDAEQLCLPF